MDPERGWGRAAEAGDLLSVSIEHGDQIASGAAGVGLRFIVDLEAGKATAQIGKTLQVLQALGCSFNIRPPPEPGGGRNP